MFCTKKIKNNKKYVKNGKMLAHVIFSSYFCGVKKEHKKRSEKITPFYYYIISISSTTTTILCTFPYFL